MDCLVVRGFRRRARGQLAHRCCWRRSGSRRSTCCCRGRAPYPPLWGAAARRRSPCCWPACSSSAPTGVCAGNGPLLRLLRHRRRRRRPARHAEQPGPRRPVVRPGRAEHLRPVPAAGGAVPDGGHHHHLRRRHHRHVPVRHHARPAGGRLRRRPALARAVPGLASPASSCWGRCCTSCTQSYGTARARPRSLGARRERRRSDPSRTMAQVARRATRPSRLLRRLRRAGHEDGATTEAAQRCATTRWTTSGVELGRRSAEDMPTGWRKVLAAPGARSACSAGCPHGMLQPPARTCRCPT